MLVSVIVRHVRLVCVFACSQIWQYTFRQLCMSSDEHPVMLTEAAMNPVENRQRIVEIMFESFNVPFTYVALQAVLALYAAGRTTGELALRKPCHHWTAPKIIIISDLFVSLSLQAWSLTLETGLATACPSMRVTP